MDDPSQDHHRTALVLYGSETGNAQDVAEEIGRLTERLRFTTRVSQLDQINVNEISQYSVVIFSISTTGQGDLPRNSHRFWKKLRSTRLTAKSLSAVSFASFGLGDSSYPKYNWAHRKLRNRLLQLGANSICEKGESDEQHPEGIDGTFLPWNTKLRLALLEEYPLPASLRLIPDDVFLTPKWAIKIREETNGSRPGLYDGHNYNGSLAPKLSLSAIDDGSPANGPKLMRDTESFTTKLLKVQRLTPPSHWQDVRLFEFSCPSLDYLPGDVLTIFPHNSDSDVDKFLEMMEWQPWADKTLAFIPTQDPKSSVLYPSAPFSTTNKTSPLTLRKLLTEYLDITAIPRRSFFASIAHFTDDETQKERLVEFTDPQYVDELYDYTTRPRRSILEVLQEFNTVKIPYKWAVSILPHIRGRQFSIASGGSQKFIDDRTGRIELLVAIVKYKTVIKKIREGLCTKYLASLEPGAELQVLFCKGGMQYDLTRSALMIGPGTGVAPLRAIVHERAWRNSINNLQPTKNVLFFGGRNRNADYFFEEEWTFMSDLTHLEVFPAFSRDQRNKIYVQDLLKEQSALVYNLLQHGVVYICGSSGKMPQAVRQALIEILEKEGQIEYPQAEQALAKMEKDGRYQQETW